MQVGGFLAGQGLIRHISLQFPTLFLPGPFVPFPMCISLDRCPGVGWNKVNFLPSSWCRAVFGILSESNVDNTLMA